MKRLMLEVFGLSEYAYRFLRTDQTIVTVVVPVINEPILWSDIHVLVVIVDSVLVASSGDHSLVQILTFAIRLLNV